MRNPNKSSEDGRFTSAVLNEAHIRQMVDDGLTRGQIAERIGCDPKTLRRFLTRHGIDPVRGQPGVAAKQAISGSLWTAWR